MSAQDPNRSAPPPPATAETGSGQEAPPLSGPVLAMVFAAIAVALVLGYLFLNKLVDISQEEDCALASRRNCGAVEIQR